MRKYCVTLTIALAGCTTSSTAEQSLQELIGRPTFEIVSALGEPASQTTIDGDTVFIWNTSYHVYHADQSTSQIDGFVDSRPVTATMTSTAYIPTRYRCIIRTISGPDNIVKHGSISGNVGGCRTYLRRIKSLSSPSER